MSRVKCRTLSSVVPLKITLLLSLQSCRCFKSNSFLDTVYAEFYGDYILADLQTKRSKKFENVKKIGR